MTDYKIDDTYDMKMKNIFTSKNQKYIISEKTLPKLEKIIKEEVNPPSKSIGIFIISFNLTLDSDDDIVLRINATPYKITSKLNLVLDRDNVGLTIRYSKDELKKYGFKKIHVKKIIKAINEKTASFKNFSDNITHILKVTS
jgi:hypothetical protein